VYDFLHLSFGYRRSIPGIDEIVSNYWAKVGYEPAKAGGTGPAPFVEGARADCLPVDSHALLLFVLWEKELRAWRLDWLAKREPGKPWVKWSDKPVLRIATDLEEPFTVYGSPQRLLFVTDSGKLHAWSESPSAEQKTEVIWADRQRPIEVVIGDALSGQAFGFTRAEKGAAVESVYFELGTKVRPVPYDPSRLKEPKADEPLDSVLEYARVLLAEKKIKQ
jgi:hypothetical protein